MSVENPCRIPEKPQLAGKNIAYRRETKLLSLESAILFRFFRDQSPRNLLCLGFLGTKPLTIPSNHPRSQEAKNLFTAASCSFFGQLMFRIGNFPSWQDFHSAILPSHWRKSDKSALYLDEFNWQRVYLGERFEMMLQHIAELYPVNDQLVSSFYCL